jgi:hypothetical protein
MARDRLALRRCRRWGDDRAAAEGGSGLRGRAAAVRRRAPGHPLGLGPGGPRRTAGRGLPHAGCPIVRRVEARFEGRYRGLDVGGLEELASRLPGLAEWVVRGLSFTEAQEVIPYRLSSWGHEVPAEANRINFVLIRS